jgi:hypothetical protein
MHEVGSISIGGTLQELLNQRDARIDANEIFQAPTDSVGVVRRQLLEHLNTSITFCSPA